MALDRPQVLQTLLGLYESPSYLEVGVNHGLTFHALRASRKVAVDPCFNFDVEAMRATPENGDAVYHEMTSDAYFESISGSADRFDVIYLDGLHTFDQTLRDLLNAVALLKEGGVIVIDDVLPSTYASSMPTMERFFELRTSLGLDEHSWMGDVFRLIFFVRDYMPAYSYATINETHGQTAIWRGTRQRTDVGRTVEDIARLAYGDAMINKAQYNFQPIADIAKALAASRSDTGRP